MKDLSIFKFIIFLILITSCDHIWTQEVSVQTLKVDTLYNHGYEGGEGLQGYQIVEIGQHVKVIPAWAFAICPTLQEVKFHSEVDSIGDNAFFSCGNLKFVNLKGVSFIGENAFKQTALKHVDLSNVRRIGDFAFHRCGTLCSIKFSQHLESIGDFSFAEDSALVTCKILSGDIGQGSFMGCRQLRRVSFRSQTRKIGKAAFLNCHSLKRVALPPLLSSIEELTFSNCHFLKAISIPPNVKSIGESAFQGSGLKTIEIPRSVNYIGHKAFADCPYLKTVIIHNSQIVIEDDAIEDSIHVIIK